MSTPHKNTLVLLSLFAVLVSAALWDRTSVHASETTVTQQNLLSAASALNAASAISPAFMPRCRETAIYVQWSAGVASGAVKVESADDPNYTGTWAPLATDTFATASSEDIIQITGVHAAIRTRISTVLAGGTVSTSLVCN